MTGLVDARRRPTRALDNPASLLEVNPDVQPVELGR